MVVVVLVAGCGGLSDTSSPSPTSDEPGEANTSEAPTPELDDTDSTQEEATNDDSSTSETEQDTEPETPSVNPANPYGKEYIYVYVNQSAEERDMQPLVDEALRYWENNTEYIGYNISFRYRDQAHLADVEIEFTNVTSCGLVIGPGHYLGCADIPQGDVNRVMSAEIQYGLSDPVATTTIKHEVGHTLGLEHEDEPWHIMNHSKQPFEGVEDVKVRLRAEDGNVPSSYEREIEEVFEYYIEHEDSIVPEDAGISFVDSATQAHLLITYDPVSGSCEFGRGGGSCIVEGEYGDQNDIQLDDLDHSVVAYHVGYHLWQFYLDEPPEALDTDSRSERERWPS